MLYYQTFYFCGINKASGMMKKTINITKWLTTRPFVLQYISPVNKHCTNLLHCLTLIRASQMTCYYYKKYNREKETNTSRGYRLQAKSG